MELLKGVGLVVVLWVLAFEMEFGVFWGHSNFILVPGS